MLVTRPALVSHWWEEEWTKKVVLKYACALFTFFSCFIVQLSTIGLLWAKPYLGEHSWAPIGTGKKVLANLSRNFYVWSIVSCIFFFKYISQLIRHLAMEERLHRASLWAKSQSPASSTPLAPTDTQPPTALPPITQPTPAPSNSVTASQLNSTPLDMQPPTTPTSEAPPITQQTPVPSSSVNVPVHSTTPSTDSHLTPHVSSVIPETALNSNFTTQAPLLFPQTIPNSGFALNPTQAFFPTLQNIPNFGIDANLPTAFFGTSNPQQSLSDLMSEAMYTWPNQQGLASGYSTNQDLFDFSALRNQDDFNANANTNNFLLPGMNVRLLLLPGLQHLYIIHVTSSPQLSSTTQMPMLPRQMSTCQSMFRQTSMLPRQMSTCQSMFRQMSTRHSKSMFPPMSTTMKPMFRQMSTRHPKSMLSTMTTWLMPILQPSPIRTLMKGRWKNWNSASQMMVTLYSLTEAIASAKKTCHPDEDLPASTKRAKVSGKK